MAYGLKASSCHPLNCAPKKKQLFVLYTEWKKNAKFKKYFSFWQTFYQIKNDWCEWCQQLAIVA